MTTLLNTFANSEIKVRFKEPFLTQGLNQKLYSVQPAGTYRGYNLTTSVNLLRIVVQTDPTAGDHVAVYGTADGYALTLRKSGDFEVDLTALASKTVVIALYADYTLNKDTGAEVRAYELLPVDEFTGAPERSELVVLGTVVVPAAGLIPAANITPDRRTSAWQNIAPEARVWHQVIQNGSFEVAKAGVLGATDESDFPGWSAAGIAPASLALSIDQTNPHTDSNCLKVTGDGTNTGETQLYQERTFAIIPGARVRAAMWVAGDTVSAGGFGATGRLAVSVFFYDHNIGIVGSAAYLCNAGQLDGTFAYQELEGTLTAPATAEFVSFGLSAFDQTAVPGTMTGSYFVDDVRVWVEAIAVQADDLSERPLITGAVPQESLDISAFLASSSMDDFVEKILRLRYDDEVGGVKEYEWKHRKGALDWLLKLVNGGVRVERAIEALGSDLIGSSAAGALPRVTTPIPVFTTARYVLLWEVQKIGSAGNFRIYASDAANRTSYTDDVFCLTFNAKWGGATWAYDISLEDAFRVDICKNRVSVLSYPASGVTPWADAAWDSGGASGSEHLRVERDSTFTSILTLLGKALISRNLEDLGSALVGSAVDGAIPRVHAPFPRAATARYVLLWEADSTGVGTTGVSLRIYASDTTSRSSTNLPALCLVVNAQWNGTQWVRDTGYYALRLDLMTSRAVLCIYAMSSPGTWSDSAWDDDVGGSKVWEATNFTEGGNNGFDQIMTAGRVRLRGGNASNPLKSVAPTGNALYSKNIVKAWAKIYTGVSPTLVAGFGVSPTITYSGQMVVVTLTTAMAPEQGTGNPGDYVVIANPQWTSAWGSVMPAALAASSFMLRYYEETAGTIGLIDLSADARYIMVVVMGEQA